MSGWQYFVERLGHPLTKGDARMERSIEQLRMAAPGSQINENQRTLHYLEGEMNDLLGRGPRCAEDRLNEIGRDGWELVSVFVDVDGPVAVFKKAS